MHGLRVLALCLGLGCSTADLRAQAAPVSTAPGQQELQVNDTVLKYYELNKRAAHRVGDHTAYWPTVTSAAFGTRAQCTMEPLVLILTSAPPTTRFDRGRLWADYHALLSSAASALCPGWSEGARYPMRVNGKDLKLRFTLLRFHAYFDSLSLTDDYRLKYGPIDAESNIPAYASGEIQLVKGAPDDRSGVNTSAESFVPRIFGLVGRSGQAMSEVHDLGLRERRQHEAQTGVRSDSRELSPGQLAFLEDAYAALPHRDFVQTLTVIRPRMAAHRRSPEYKAFLEQRNRSDFWSNPEAVRRVVMGGLPLVIKRFQCDTAEFEGRPAPPGCE